MPRKQLRFGPGFSVVLGNRRAQAATMVLGPGDCEGGPDNRHRGSDQWLYVLSGKGEAVVGGKRRAAGVLWQRRSAPPRPEVNYSVRHAVAADIPQLAALATSSAGVRP